MSGAITPEFVFDLESNMRIVQAQEFQRLSQEAYWQLIAKTMQSGAKKERISWLLDSGSLNAYVEEGSMEFEEMVANTTEYESQFVNMGLRVKRAKFEDLDGNGVQLATNWVRQKAAQFTHWPQKQLALAILAGESENAYDGEAYFSGSHPNNPFDDSAGTYANLHATAVGAGALPIDDSVSLEEAVENLGKAIAYIEGSLLMPNGEDPRMLRVSRLVVPPRMKVRAQQLTNAKFIAQDSKGGGGGSADVSAVITNWALNMPIVARELGSAFANGSDTSYYLLCDNILTDELGAFTYVLREPFGIGLVLARLRGKLVGEGGVPFRFGLMFGFGQLHFLVGAEERRDGE